MSGISYNNKNMLTPVGSIMYYLGTSTPDGWVICDGVPRSNTDSRYNTLITMNIGTASNGNYTPPNLQDMFLRQINGDSIGNTGGSNSITLTTSNLPSHNHSITVDNSNATHSHSGVSDSMDRNYSHSHTGTTGSMSENVEHSHFCELKQFGDGQVTGNENENPFADSQYQGAYLTTNSTDINHTHNIVTYNTGTDHTHSFTTNDSNATHNHGASSANTGSGTAFDPRPPWYAVNYILKY
jgi:microcystin-dependent protein